MKSLRVGLAVWVLCAIVLGLIGGGVAQASGLPDNLGPLQDRAGFFTAEQKAEIKQDIASKENLGFYVLTVGSLNGRDAAEYATAIYEHWGLEERDVLFLIAQQERIVEVRFNNDQLKAAMDNQLPADYDDDGNTTEPKINEILDVHFVPFAREGNFKEALTQTFLILDPLKVDAAPTVETTEAPATTAIEENNSAASEPGGFQTFMGKVFHILWQVILWSALVILVIVIFRRWRTGAHLQAEIREYRRISGELMVTVNRSLEGVSALAEISKGRTERVAKELEGTLTDLLIAAEELSKKPEREGFVLGLAKLEKEQTRLNQGVALLNRTAERAIESAEELAGHEQEVPKIVQRLQSETRTGLSAYEELEGLLEGPVEPMRREFKELEELLHQAREHAVLDVLTARDWTGRAERSMAALASSLQELLKLSRRYQAYPELERQIRQSIKHVIQEHNLYEREQDIYHILEESSKLVPQLLQFLRKAEIISARTQWQRMEKLLAEARDKADRLAELQSSNNSKAAVLDDRVRELDRLVKQLDQEFFRLSNAFKKSLWQPLETDFVQLKREHAAARIELEKANELQARQQFQKAKERFDDLAIGAKQLEKKLLQCEQNIIQLDEQKQAAIDGFEKARAAFESLKEEVHASDLIILPEAGLEADYRVVEEVAKRFREAADIWPCDLQHLQKQEALHKEAIAQCREHYEQIQQKKEHAVTTLERFTILFHRVIDTTSGIFYKMARKRDFRELDREMHALIESGRYNEAIEQLAELQRFIDTVVNKGEYIKRTVVQQPTVTTKTKERRKSDMSLEQEMSSLSEKSSSKSKSVEPTGPMFDWGGKGPSS
ncbi:TPM domain-containing protein [Paenibacillus daejeonensis]|uniref:TPM domain-containing protein n=1 Tax=Paenibacillus daejeonensis TaxID=135193 RepID=UPI00037C3664|nr:TPM domain-containing protein [Paenibacillus daejeonensis]